MTSVNADESIMCCECDVQWRLMQRISKLRSHLFTNDFEVIVFLKTPKT